MLKSIGRGGSVVVCCTLLFSAARLCAQMSVGEQRTSAAFARAAKNPLELRAFLQEMPKGGELHFHLGGAVYAETVLRNAAEDNLCVNLATHSLAENTGLTKSTPPHALCAAGLVSAETVDADNKLRDSMIDTWSMRSFVPYAGVSGHDHFFSTFLRAGTRRSHQGEWLDEVATRAAGQNVQYLEIMTNTSLTNVMKAAGETPWNPDLPAMREALLAKGVRNDIAVGRSELDQMESTRKLREHCDTPQAEAACSVLVRYLGTISREAPPERAFAQALFLFEFASVDPRVVGVNIAQPEDGVLSMAEYHRQMEMLDYLHSVYPKVHLSLHAGELAFGMVPPDGLRFHIREAVELGHAERIGHGVDIMYEDHPHALLNEMAEKHIMVEINLTSNDVILGVRGRDHPLPIYLAHHVPIAFSTDDEGVSRIDLTHEYVRAVQEFGLGYMDLKRSARTSIEHSFLPGKDLWVQQDAFAKMTAECVVTTSKRCALFLDNSEKARQEMELERRFQTFETAKSSEL
jgi:adenosine deaminase